MCPH